MFKTKRFDQVKEKHKGRLFILFDNYYLDLPAFRYCMADVVTLADGTRLFADNENFDIDSLVIENGILKQPSERIESTKDKLSKRNIVIPSNDSSTQLLKQFLGIKGRTRKSKDDEEDIVVPTKEDSDDESEESSESEEESEYSDEDDDKNNDSDS